MARLAPARRTALKVVSECRRRGARVRDLLRTSDAMAVLDARDRALASRLALGATAASGVLDQLLARYLKRPSSLEPQVRDALRLATFEACYLDTPASVVVSQGVELVRSVSPRAAGLANAVLRKVTQEAAALVAASRARCLAGEDTLEDLALTSGLPMWLLGQIRDARGPQAVCKLALAQHEPAPVYVTGNAARVSLAKFPDALREAGLDAAQTDVPGAYVLRSAAGLASSGLVEQCVVVTSDLAAQEVARMVGPRPGQRVLEVGQGRGTKTLLLQNEAQLHGGVCDVVGIDSEAFKTRIAAKRMQVAGLSDHVTCVTHDGRNLGAPSLPDELDGLFDLVFIDAPCSGTGTMRRHPEIPWTLEQDAVQEGGSLPQLQLALLQAAAARVRPGGRLAYATCSVLPTENEQVVDRFLATDTGADFAPDPIHAPDEVFATSIDAHGCFQSMPAVGACDGHFCAVMRRKG